MIYRMRVLAAGLVLGILFAGCAVPVKGPPADRSLQIAQAYIRAGRDHEASGDLVSALRDFNLALTANPGNREAITSRDRLEAEIRSSGLALEKRGRYSLARKEFLTALRLCPDYGEARERLTPRKHVEIGKYLIHTIQEGDTLSKLAALYYGDYRKFPLIARYNNISDAAALRVGQTIKIPGAGEVEPTALQKDVKKGPAQANVASRELESNIPEADHMGPSAGSVLILERDEEEQVAIYRDLGVELFNEKRYESAIVEFNKVLSSNPDDRIALDYLYRCYFRRALSLYEQKKYLAARDRFRMSLRYKKDCQQCHRYVNQCEKSYLKDHYRRGMQYYNNERLKQAIAEWELVRKEDPDYKRVNYLINKARTILNKLDQLKKEGQAGQ